MTDDEPRKRLTVISLGWGVQSWTMAAMVALGELPPVDFAIHADTTWERERTYQFAEKWTPWLEGRGVKVVTVRDGSTDGILEGKFAPVFTTNKSYHNILSAGRRRRQCTQRWKVAPLRRYVSTQLNGNKYPGSVETWLGITLDEWERAKDSNVKYIRHRFPLLEMNFTRADCLHWLDQNHLPSPGKSACTFCPYHNRVTWQQMKREDGVDWKQAVWIDEVIRDKGHPYRLYLHQLKPLPEAVKIPEDYGATQLSFLASDNDDAECDSGYCFL